MFIHNNNNNSQWLLLVGALVALAAGAGAGAGATNDRAVSEQLMNKLRNKKWSDVLDNGQVHELLEKAVEVDGQNDEASRLVAAASLSESRCTVEYQQWLISKLVHSQGTPLGAYIANIRDNYRKLCLTSFKRRFMDAMIGLDVAAETTVEALSLRLGEAHEMEYTADDDLSLKSLVGGLKEYLADEVELATGKPEQKAILRLMYMPNVLRSSYEAQNAIETAVERLTSACDKLTGAFGDSLWLLKVIDQQALELAPQIKRLLWDTHVCQALHFGRFEAQLQMEFEHIDAHYRELVAKFTNLLRVPDEIWSDNSYELTIESAKEALDRLVDEQHFRTREAEKFEVATELLDELETACQMHAAELHEFLWLVDTQLKTELASKKSIDILKRVRACSLVPFFH